MFKFLIPVVLLVTITACESVPVTESEKPVRQTRTDGRSPAALLQEATIAGADRAAELRVLAATKSYNDGDIEQAGRILKLVQNPGAIGSAIYNYQLLTTKFAMREGEPAVALEALNAANLRALELSESQIIELGLLRSDAYRANRSYVASARERIYLDGSLNTRDRQANHERIFTTLQELPASVLVTQANNAVTNDVRGWLSLAALSRQYQENPVRQLRELNNWKLVWGSHPAAAQLPASLHTLAQVVSEQPRHVALLLPLQGEFAVAGRAVRDGVISAHYRYSPDTTLTVFDTAGGTDVATLAQQAEAAGAEIIIGPLERDKVAELALTLQKLPVLALNRVEIRNPSVYQFGLAPEDEVIQVATQIETDRMTSGIVIAPIGEWGDRNIAEFEQAYPGNLIEIVRYSDQRDYSDLVKGLLKVDESQDRSDELRRILGQRFEFTPRRRQDIDFIFLLANPVQARRINPALAFFYADDIPVYATSHIHERSESRIDNIDLNGIRFCDIPWKLTQDENLQTEINSIWPDSRSSLARFYALGVDAYRLVPRLQQLSQLPEQRLFGATGVLRIQDGVVYRRLMWGRFSEGSVVTVPIIVQEG